MTDIKTLNLSESILTKLSNKNVKNFSEKECLALKSVEGGSNVTAKGLNSVTSIFVGLVSNIEGKKLKTNRLPKFIVICENAEKSKSIIDEINSLITKEIVSVLCADDESMKKLKKKCSNVCDFIVGQSNKINQLISADSIKTKEVKAVVLVSADKVIVEQNEKNLEEIFQKLNENGETQSVILSNESSTKVDNFVKKFVKISVNIADDDSEDEESGEEESSDEDVVAKVNGDSESSEDGESSEEEEKEEVKENKKMEAEEKVSEINQELINKVKSVVDFESLKDTAEKLIKEDGDVISLSKALSLIAPKTSKKVVHSGPGSKLTGREGYTAYLFMSNQELFNKGYLFKSLKRNIDGDLVEKIERARHTKDKMGFVFDLASEHDETFQGSWSDGKYDTMCLLEEVPELLEEENKQGGSGRGRGGFERGGRGGFERGGRGGFERGGRGGFERGGRGGFERGGRGGFERGGRGGFERGRGDRGGKRPFNGGSETSAKVQKFE